MADAGLQSLHVLVSTGPRSLPRVFNGTLGGARRCGYEFCFICMREWRGHTNFFACENKEEAPVRLRWLGSRLLVACVLLVGRRSSQTRRRW
jgi:hypothetical protein